MRLPSIILLLSPFLFTACYDWWNGHYHHRAYIKIWKKKKKAFDESGSDEIKALREKNSLICLASSDKQFNELRKKNPSLSISYDNGRAYDECMVELGTPNYYTISDYEYKPIFYFRKLVLPGLPTEPNELSEFNKNRKQFYDNKNEKQNYLYDKSHYICFDYATENMDIERKHSQQRPTVIFADFYVECMAKRKTPLYITVINPNYKPSVAEAERKQATQGQTKQ